MWGAIHCYAALKAEGHQQRHELPGDGPVVPQPDQPRRPSARPARMGRRHRAQFRRDMLLPFFNQYLKAGAPKADTPPVLIYNTGANHWDRFNDWPLSCDEGCADSSKPLYLAAGGRLSSTRPRQDAADEVRRICLRSGQARALLVRGPLSPPTTTPGAPGWCAISALSTAAPTC